MAPFPAWPQALPPHQGADKNATPLQQVDATKEETESRPIEVEDRDADRESDEISLLGEEEASKFQDFNPRLEQDESWTPPAAMLRFLEENLNQVPPDKERQAILANFPKPNCDVVQPPRLDKEVKDQLLQKGLDPKFGSEKTLFKLQEQLLEVTGPLTCLWHDLLQPDVRPSNEQMIHLIQRVLVLLGGTSQAINVERRRIVLGPGLTVN